jgi:hypothetical protein
MACCDELSDGGRRTGSALQTRVALRRRATTCIAASARRRFATVRLLA